MEQGKSLGRWLVALGIACAGPALAASPVTPRYAPPVDEVDAEDYAQAMFDFLVAEMAAQRGDTAAAVAAYLRLAREHRDAQIARRAVETAIRARAFGPALDAATLLLELEPESSLGREIMAALLANEGDIPKARERLAAILEKSADRAGLMAQLSHLFAKFVDKAAVLEATRALVAPYEEMAEAHYAIGVAALVAGDVEAAMAESKAALERKPAWQQAAILRAQVLRKSAPGDLIPFYRDFVERHPDSFDVRMQLGRELAGERKLAEARDQFRAAEKLAPKDPQPAYAIGLIGVQLEDFAEAQVAFTRALKGGYRDPAAIYLGLGQAAEGLKRFDEAIEWYKRVDSSDWVRAQLKIATLLSRQQGLQAGREYLQRIEPRSGEDRIQMIQVEAQLLREAKAWKETYDMLTQAVEAHPESYELRYDRAMAAERVDRIDVLESELRRVIEMKPDYAHAYNALGYTLAEKTDRLEEAKVLIDKAVKLAPEDPFILDSLGWILYRLGHAEEALKHLQSAYTARPDPEIAAHLGEVLWKVGQRDEAQKIWRAALSENPGHESLIAVMQKYRP